MKNIPFQKGKAFDTSKASPLINKILLTFFVVEYFPVSKNQINKNIITVSRWK